MILAAGLGTRLRPLTYLMPKPMAPVLDTPVMEHTARLLKQHGFEQVITNLSYLPEQIREHFGDGCGSGIELSYSEEAEPLGTAGGVGKVRDFLAAEDSFLAISGDALTDIDLAAMRKAHEASGGIATLATKRVADTTQFGVAITDEGGRIQGFQEKPEPAEALSDLANCGIYMFRAEIFDYFPEPGHRSPAGDDDQPDGFVDWAMDVFPALLENDVPFHSHEIQAYWNDIGSIDEYLQGNADALNGEIEIERPPEVAEGVFAAKGSDLDGVKVKPPVMIGPGCEIGAGVDLQGPVVVGEGCRIGPAAMLATPWCCRAPSSARRDAGRRRARRQAGFAVGLSRSGAPSTHSEAQAVTRRLPLVPEWSCCERSRAWRRPRVAAPAGAIAGSSTDLRRVRWRARRRQAADRSGAARRRDGDRGRRVQRRGPGPGPRSQVRPSARPGGHSRGRDRRRQPARASARGDRSRAPRRLALALAWVRSGRGDRPGSGRAHRPPVLAVPAPHRRAQAGRAPEGGPPRGPSARAHGRVRSGRVPASRRRLDHRRHARRLRGGAPGRRLRRVVALTLAHSR